MTLHEEMKSSRLRLGLTKSELARQLDISVQYVNDIEKARVNPSLNVAVKLARRLGLSLDEIFLKG